MSEWMSNRFIEEIQATKQLFVEPRPQWYNQYQICNNINIINIKSRNYNKGCGSGWRWIWIRSPLKKIGSGSGKKRFSFIMRVNMIKISFNLNLKSYWKKVMIIEEFWIWMFRQDPDPSVFEHGFVFGSVFSHTQIRNRIPDYNSPTSN